MSNSKEEHAYTLCLPFKPDIITAYKIGLCELCDKEKKKNPSFDNSGCPHCKKHDKTIHWSMKI